MEKIPAKDRFSQNLNSISMPDGLLRKAILQSGMDPKTSELKRLDGGFMNANFLASDEREKIVLRVYATDSRAAQKEFDLLRFLESHPVLTPKALGKFEIHGRPVVAMEYLDGVTLEDRLLNGEPLDSTIYEAIGRELGAVHNIHFERAGFIGPKMKIGPEFENFTVFIGQFIKRTLKELESQPDKLDLETNRRFRRLVEDKWHLAVETERVPQLTHCDFNPKNILISKEKSPRVLGLIDWEFSDSGNGIIDLGNFFRFAYDYPDRARDEFVRGYTAVNSDLHPNWEATSRLIDLGNMCGFLERKEDYQKSFRTARAVIKSTLDHFGY